MTRLHIVCRAFVFWVWGMNAFPQNALSHIDVSGRSFFADSEIRRPLRDEHLSLSLATPPVNDIETWIVRLVSGNRREEFLDSLDRGKPFRAMIEQTLRYHGIPSQFYFLPLVESSFLSRATSSRNAVGLWQLLPTTGMIYGLVITDDSDERRNPLRSTQAAACYLRSLHQVFHSWELVVAAYNAGETRVRSAIRRAHSTDFWTLSRQKALPGETIELVPKFLAAIKIGENPKAFGLVRKEGNSSRSRPLEPTVRLNAWCKTCTLF